MPADMKDAAVASNAYPDHRVLFRRWERTLKRAVPATAIEAAGSSAHLSAQKAPAFPTPRIQLSCPSREERCLAYALREETTCAPSAAVRGLPTALSLTAGISQWCMNVRAEDARARPRSPHITCGRRPADLP